MRIALVVALFLAGCGESVPVSTSLSALSQAQMEFNGRNVIVRGTLRGFESPRHYWIENDSFDRVALQGVGNLAPWEDQTIEVRGTFLYDREAGRRINVDEFVVSP